MHGGHSLAHGCSFWCHFSALELNSPPPPPFLFSVVYFIFKVLPKKEKPELAGENLKKSQPWGDVSHGENAGSSL